MPASAAAAAPYDKHLVPRPRLSVLSEMPLSAAPDADTDIVNLNPTSSFTANCYLRGTCMQQYVTMLLKYINKHVINNEFSQLFNISVIFQ